MKKARLIDKLIDCQGMEAEKAHSEADKLLLEYINDGGIKEAFTEVIRLTRVKGLMTCPDLLEDRL